MNKPLTYFLILFCTGILQSQKFEIVTGSIEAISGIQRYNLVFEYAQDLKIRGNDSEQTFLQRQFKKREKKEPGSGEQFKKLWFKNRVDLYEPTFIQQFNSFRLENDQVTAAKNIISAGYTMHVKTISIAAGYDDFFYVEGGEIEVHISIYKTSAPENIVYALNTVVRGSANANEFERIRTAYGNLGEAVSKHFSRKGLLKNK